MRVGFIGLGSQGGPMAGRIIDAGFPTTLWARRPASLEPFVDTAAAVADSPAELAAASDLVCLCVVGDADIEDVATGEHGVLSRARARGRHRRTQHRAPQDMSSAGGNSLPHSMFQ